MKDQRIEELINDVKQGNKNEKEKNMETLIETYKRWINSCIRRIKSKLPNTHQEDLKSVAHFGLYEGTYKFDNQKHKSAYNYLGNYIWDELKRYAKFDRDGAFPGIFLGHNAPEDGDGEMLNLVEDASADYRGQGSLNPEELTIQKENWAAIAKFRESIKDNGNGKRLRVLEDILTHPDDSSLRTIASRNNIPKSTVGDIKTRIAKEIIPFLPDEWLHAFPTGQHQLRKLAGKEVSCGPSQQNINS